MCKGAAPEACLLASLRRPHWLVPGGRRLQPCGLIPAGIRHNHTALRHLPPLCCTRTAWIRQGLRPVQRSHVHWLVSGTLIGGQALLSIVGLDPCGAPLCSSAHCGRFSHPPSSLLCSAPGLRKVAGKCVKLGGRAGHGGFGGVRPRG